MCQSPSINSDFEPLICSRCSPKTVRLSLPPIGSRRSPTTALSSSRSTSFPRLRDGSARPREMALLVLLGALVEDLLALLILEADFVEPLRAGCALAAPHALRLVRGNE